MLRPLPITIYGNCRYKNFRLMAADDSRAKRCSAGEKMLEEDPLGDIAVLTTICQQPPAAAIVHPHACL